MGAQAARDQSPHPIIVCMVCGEGIARAADAVFTKDKVVHVACHAPESRRVA